MISTTSLFNNGIFKNTLKRFKWGSFLYFIILFFALPFNLLVRNLDNIYRIYPQSQNQIPIILRNSYMVFPAILAVVIPTIVAALCFNTVHSSKQGIFVHALPVTRKSCYVSTLAAGFSLMAIPVLLNAAILLVMGLTSYSEIIPIWSVLYWTALNLSILFVTFSLAVFTAFLTGNTAAHIAINVFLHILPMLVALTIYLISDVFLFGFTDSDSFIANEIMNNTPIVWLFGRAINYSPVTNIFGYAQLWIFLLGAAIVYILGYQLYKKRKIEACGDVAAFKSFRPVLKYLTVSAVTVAIFGMFTGSIPGVAMFIMAFAAAVIVYFACEMLMSKTFRVFGTYKGLIGFTAFAALFISFFAYTSVFGYETRIPDFEDIESASLIENWRYEIPLTDNAEAIKSVQKLHGECISDITVLDNNKPRNISIKYNLKNGKTLSRRYNVDEALFAKAMSEMYTYPDFKLKIYNFDKVNIDKVDRFDLNISGRRVSTSINLYADTNEFLKAVYKDFEELSYKEMELDNFPVCLHLGFDLSKEDNDKKQFFDPSAYSDNRTYYSFNIALNANYKHTYEFLKEKGYYDDIIAHISKDLYMCKVPVFYDSDEITYKEDTGYTSEFYINTDDCVLIDKLDSIKLAEAMFNEPHSEEYGNGKKYLIFSSLNYTGEKNIWFNNYLTAYGEKELPEYLKKYLD